MMRETLSPQIHNHAAVKRTFWAAAAFYMLITFEFLYMASPFAAYFYSVYKPGLTFFNSHPTLAWLSSIFLPHIAIETSSVLINLHNVAGAILAAVGFTVFCIGAGQVYYNKLTRKGAVTGGIYNLIRHPQYMSLVICSFGLLLLWPRYIVMLSFVTMLFAYYFLARVEEKECEKKFGQRYIEYKNRTNMFLPFNMPLADKLPGLPKARMKRYALLFGLYALTLLIAIGLASGLQNWSLNSLYALYTKDAAYISVGALEKSNIEAIVDTALASPEVQNRLSNSSEGSDAKFLNYILPTEWHVSEIPMNPVEGGSGHHFPTTYDENSYKIVFTRTKLRTEYSVEGKEIITNTVTRIPVLEVWIDLAQKQVTEIKNAPDTINYEGIPVPVY